MALFDMSGVFELDDYGYLLRGSDVIAGLDLEDWGQGVEVSFQLA